MYFPVPYESSPLLLVTIASAAYFNSKSTYDKFSGRYGETKKAKCGFFQKAVILCMVQQKRNCTKTVKYNACHRKDS
jgi:hypothetical protein